MRGACGSSAAMRPPVHDSAVAIRNVAVDRLVPAEEIASVIQEFAAQPVPAGEPVPSGLLLEARIAESEHSSVALQNEVGALTPLTCPDCGGPLWRAKSGPLRFRCLVGHAHSAGSMESGQRRNLERALWAAIRQFEQGRSRVVSSYRERAAQARQNGEALRALLLTAANKSRMPLDWSPSPVKSRYHATSLPPGLPLRSVRCRPRTRCRPVSYPD